MAFEIYLTAGKGGLAGNVISIPKAGAAQISNDLFESAKLKVGNRVVFSADPVTRVIRIEISNNHYGSTIYGIRIGKYVPIRGLRKWLLKRHSWDLAPGRYEANVTDGGIEFKT
jgi:hypothetical protein